MRSPPEKRVQRKLTISKEPTPLQQKLKKLADLISVVGYSAAAAIFAALLVRGLWTGEVHFTPRGDKTTRKPCSPAARHSSTTSSNGHYHRRRCAGRPTDECDGLARPGDAKYDAGQ